MLSDSLGVTVLAPFVELVVQLLGKGDVGYDDGVKGRWGITRSGRVVATRMILVLALGVTLPGHAILGDTHGRLGGGRSG